MTYLIYITFFFSTVWIVRNILYWLFLWQVKEYRLDRLIVHLKETVQGKSLFTQFDGIAKLILILLSLFSYPSSDPTLFQILFSLFFSTYLYDFILTVQEVHHRRLRKPVFTQKVIVILLCTFFILFFTFFLSEDLLFILPLVDKIAPLSIAFFIALFSIPSRIYHQYIIQKAKSKILQFPNLKIIGITGCYGKGSTKEYLSTILSEKFHILKTFETQNTPIGIAQTILSNLNKKTDIFIVEVGAYKTGETAEIARLIHPQTAIITPVEDQHLSLFGSLHNLMTATFELIENLPKNGLALFDGNSFHAKELYDKTDGASIRRILCYTNHKNEKSIKGDITADKIKVEQFFVSFDVILKKKKLGRFRANVLGSHHIENILPGIYLAKEFGIPTKEIKKGVQKIIPWKNTMEPFHSPSGSILVDDSFNASPGATLAALNYLSIYKGKKILVLQPFIELGKNASIDHRKVGEKIGETCDFLILTNTNYYHELLNGIQKTQNRCNVLVAQVDEIVTFLRSNTTKGDVVVFEGKEAGLSFIRMK